MPGTWGLAFAYSTNGHEILEYDFFKHASQSLDRFPSPQDLWLRWQENTGLNRPLPGQIKEAPAIYGVPDMQTNPLLYPYCPESLCGKRPYYFQEVAIREVLLCIMRGQKWILLTMATGTGKTFVAFQVVWKLIKSRWLQNSKEAEALPSPMEIVASLLEREREILSIVEELDELLGNSESALDSRNKREEGR